MGPPIPGRKLPPLETLRHLEACGRHSSFSKAARELHVTHGAVSQRIKSLETSIGVKLFEREGNTMLLTHKGRLLYLEVTRILDDLRRSLESVQQADGRSTLKISFPPALAARWLYPRLFQFTREHPDMEIEVGTGLELSNFQQDGVELAVRFGSGPGPGLAGFKLLDEAFFPVCSPAFLAAHRPTRPADLLQLPMLRDEFVPWELWLRAAGVSPTQPIRGISFSDGNLLLRAAADGRGVALGRATLVGEEIEAGHLVRLFDVAVRGDSAYHVVHPRGSEDLPKIRLFCDWLKVQAAQAVAP